MNANVHISEIQECQDGNVGCRNYRLVRGVKNENVLHEYVRYSVLQPGLAVLKPPIDSSMTNGVLRY